MSSNYLLKNSEAEVNERCAINRAARREIIATPTTVACSQLVDPIV